MRFQVHTFRLENGTGVSPLNWFAKKRQVNYGISEKAAPLPYPCSPLNNFP